MRRLGSTGRAALPLAAALSVAAALLGATPAHAGDTFVQVTPNPAHAGSRVAIHASCGDGNTVTAAVTSEAFGRVVVMPRDGVLVGHVTIPASKKPGRYNVHLQCQNERTADSPLTITDGTPAPTETPIITMSPPEKGPETGGGGTASSFGDDRLLLTGGLTTAGFGLALGALALMRRRAATSRGVSGR